MNKVKGKRTIVFEQISLVNLPIGIFFFRFRVYCLILEKKFHKDIVVEAFKAMVSD